MAQFLRPFLRVCRFIFVLFLAYFALHLALYHFHLITFPYPTTLREGEMMASTDALVHGHDPFDMALQPQYTNTYGIIYPLLVWPWAKLFGTTLLVHRAVTAFFILASCVLIFFVLKKMNIPILLNIWAVLMLYSSWLFPATTTPSTDPGATGMFFFLAAIFIPWYCRYSYKSLVCSVISGVLAYYTKPYFVLGIAIMGSYLFFFISKKTGVFYGLLWLVMMIISVVVVNQICQAYFDNCFFGMTNMGPEWSTIERLNLQIYLYTYFYKWTLLLMGAFILGFGIKNLMSLRAKRSNDTTQTYFPLVLYAAICSCCVLYLSLGRHGGALLWYFYQLLSPFLLIGAAWIFSRFTYWPLVCVPFLILNLYSLMPLQNYQIFNKNALGWPELSRLVSQHQRILNSPLIAPLLIEEHKEIYDNGSTEGFWQGGPRNRFFKLFFKEDERVPNQERAYFQGIRSMVENKKFDLIILQPYVIPFVVGDGIFKYYKLEEQFKVYVPHDSKYYTVTVWAPL